MKFLSKGSNGIEEMAEDLNSGEIMYAIIKVQDPKTRLSKYVLINWQGEGANSVRKGICVNHLRDVEKFFTGTHLTINARNEDEVEPDFIMEKVSKIASIYTYKEEKTDLSIPTKPVGSNYQRVNPVKEINPKERDQFWLKEEEEEMKRIEEERKRKETERLKLEEEAKRREIAEAAEREARTQARNISIDKIKEAERNAVNYGRAGDENREYIEESEVRVNKSNLLREERKKEAQELIAQRTIDARSVFEKNTVAGQVKRVPEKPIRNSILRAQALNQTGNREFVDMNNKIGGQLNHIASEENKPKESNPGEFGRNNIGFGILNARKGNIEQKENMQHGESIERGENKHHGENLHHKEEKNTQKEIKQENNKSEENQNPENKHDEQLSDDESDQYSTIKRCPKSVTSPTSTQPQESTKTETSQTLNKEETVQITEQQFVDEVIYKDLNEPGIQARALYDYQAADETEITFDPGDIITHIELVDEGWWEGLGPDGTYGLFPANYVELI